MRDAPKRHSRYWVYVVKSADGTYYTGSTNNLENRLKLHNAGHGAKYLRGRGPVAVVYAKEYRYYKNALRAERNLKKRTRKEKEVLIGAYKTMMSSHPPRFRSLHSRNLAGGHLAPMFRFAGTQP